MLPRLLDDRGDLWAGCGVGASVAGAVVGPVLCSTAFFSIAAIASSCMTTSALVSSVACSTNLCGLPCTTYSMYDRHAESNCTLIFGPAIA